MATKRGGRAEGRWRALIREQERSGLAVAEFARRRGVSAATLYWWRSQLSRRDGSRRGRRPKLVAVEVVGSKEIDPSGGDRGFELELAGGRRLRVPARFDAEALSRLIAAVERAC
jgi:transposase-like protein